MAVTAERSRLPKSKFFDRALLWAAFCRAVSNSSELRILAKVVLDLLQAKRYGAKVGMGCLGEARFGLPRRACRKGCVLGATYCKVLARLAVEVLARLAVEGRLGGRFSRGNACLAVWLGDRRVWRARLA